MSTLILMYTSEDGIHVQEISEAGFLAALVDTDETWATHIEWKSSLKEFDVERTNNGIVIKGGTVIAPKPVKVVTQFTLEG